MTRDPASVHSKVATWPCLSGAPLDGSQYNLAAFGWISGSGNLDLKPSWQMSNFLVIRYKPETRVPSGVWLRMIIMISVRHKTRIFVSQKFVGVTFMTPPISSEKNDMKPSTAPTHQRVRASQNTHHMSVGSQFQVLRLVSWEIDRITGESKLVSGCIILRTCGFLLKLAGQKVCFGP